MATTADPSRPVGVPSTRAITSHGWWSDRLVGTVLGAVACTVLALVVLMTGYIVDRAWPSFAANGLGWFDGRGDVNLQLQDIFASKPPAFDYVLSAWPLLWGTALCSGLAVVIGLAVSLFAAIFLVEFAPPRVARILEPVIRLLAGVPSVVYGLIGVLVLVPFVGEHLISDARKESVAYVIQLSGSGVLVATLILTVMILPVMVAIVADALRSVPSSWREGAAALGVNRWRAVWTISVRAARPSIIAAAVLAMARALGEAVMLAMVSGGVAFAPQPIDGLTFIFEPLLTFAAAIVLGAEGISVQPYGDTLFAFATVILFSSVMLSLIGWTVRRRLHRYGVQG